MKAFIFRSAVKSVRYEVFETIINIYCRFICLCGDEFIVIILNVHIVYIYVHILSPHQQIVQLFCEHTKTVCNSVGGTNVTDLLC
jgi:hypothetical protein